MGKKISELSELTIASSILGTYVIPVESGTTTYKVTVANMGAKFASITDNTPVIVSTATTSSIAATTDALEVTAAGATTQTLPATIANKWGFIVVKNLGAGTITLAATSGTTLETAYSISTLRASLTFYLSGTVWRAM